MRLLFALATASGLVIRLEPGERECFMIEVKKEAAVSGNFELIKPNDEAEPLAVTVSADDQPPLYDIRSKADGAFAFDAREDGLLDLCIANGKKGHSDDIARTVGFAIRVTSQHTVIEEQGPGSFNELLEVTEQLNEGLLTLTYVPYFRRKFPQGSSNIFAAKGGNPSKNTHVDEVQDLLVDHRRDGLPRLPLRLAGRLHPTILRNEAPGLIRLERINVVGVGVAPADGIEAPGTHI